MIAHSSGVPLVLLIYGIALFAMWWRDRDKPKPPPNPDMVKYLETMKSRYPKKDTD